MPKLVSLDPALCCIAAACALGSPVSGCELAPLYLRQAGLLKRVERNGWTTRWQEIAPQGGSTASLAEWLQALADSAEGAVRAGERLLVVGGDHVIAAGTWRGVSRALGGAPGLIWIDAHLDAHTPATSLSGNRHGMPLAALFGHGEAAMTDGRGSCLDARRTVVIGARDWETAEWQLLESLGVRIITMPEVSARGFASVLPEAQRMLAGTPWGISLDIDALDPGQAPGVSVPVPGGIAAVALSQALRAVLRQPACIGLEIVEFNPVLDQDGRTGRLLGKIVDQASAPAA